MWVFAALLLPVALLLPQDSMPPVLQISLDGSTWGTSINEPLWTEDHHWIPGDIAAKSFWVRNNATDDGTLIITVSEITGEQLFTHDDFTLEVRTDDGTWPVKVNGSKAEVMGVVEAGAAQEIDVTLRFTPTSANVSQNQEMSFVLNVILSEDEDHGVGGKHLGWKDVLPKTGAGVAIWLLGCGLSAVALFVIIRNKTVRND